MGIILLCLALIAALFAAALIGPLLPPIVESMVLARRTRRRMGTRASTPIEAMLNLGFPPFRHLASFLLGHTGFCSMVGQTTRLLKDAGIECAPQPAGELILLVIPLWFLAIWAFTGSLPGAVVVTLLAAIVFLVMQSRRYTRLSADMVRQLPDALHDLAICSVSGLTLSQAFERTANSLRPPLAGEFAQVASDLQAGKSVDEAMEALKERIPLAEMEYLAVALSVQKRTGGSLKTLLDRSAEAVTASGDLQRTLQVQTAQARLSAWIVTLLPIGILAVVTCANPGYLDPFLASPLGWGLLLAAIGMEVGGVIMIRRILGLKVM